MRFQDPGKQTLGSQRLDIMKKWAKKSNAPKLWAPLRGGTDGQNLDALRFCLSRLWENASKTGSNGHSLEKNLIISAKYHCRRYSGSLQRPGLPFLLDTISAGG